MEIIPTITVGYGRSDLQIMPSKISEANANNDSQAQLEALLKQLLAAVKQNGNGSHAPQISPLRADTSVTVIELCNQFLLSKFRAGRCATYLAVLLKQLRQFSHGREFRFASSVTAAEIESWLHGKGWSPRTVKNHLYTVRTLFNWGIKRGDLVANPAQGVDVPTQSNEPPGIHTPEQVQKVLEAARSHDLNTMRCLAIRYFAGLRTSEAAALEEKEIGETYIEVTAKKAKTRRRRLVTIQPNLRAWLDLGGVLPLRTVNDKFRVIPPLAGVPWPKNAPRHSFVSYHLASWNNAGKTALEAGHTEQILFSNYREIVTPEAAQAFWNIRPL